MKLHKIHYRNPQLDTEVCYCINNRLWNKSKITILNDKAFLAPKYYCPRHVSQLAGQRLANKRYRTNRPLRTIRINHINALKSIEKQRQRERKKRKPSERQYKFNVSVTENEYRCLWDILYKELRDPLAKDKRAATIEELKAKRGEQ